MKKTAQKIVKRYNEWIAEDRIYKTWEHEDYEDVMVYEDINADIICIQRDANGTIVDAWAE